MRVLVVGAGAIGGYFGGRLVQAGRDVTFLVRPRRAEQIRKNGLAVRVVAGGADELNARAIVSERIEASYDLVLVCCKAYDLESAMDGFASAVGPETVILPLLNGLRHLDVLSERFGASRLLGGQCIITATLDERGHAVLLGPMATLTFGELDGTLSRRTDAIATTMQDAGFAVRVSNAVLLEMWGKWVFLATFAGMTCLMRGAIGDIVAAGAAGLTEALLAYRGGGSHGWPSPGTESANFREGMFRQPGPLYRLRSSRPSRTRDSPRRCRAAPALPGGRGPAHRAAPRVARACCSRGIARASHPPGERGRAWRSPPPAGHRAVRLGAGSPGRPPPRRA
jgi:2-dehydropantoate 2-reductase